MNRFIASGTRAQEELWRRRVAWIVAFLAPLIIVTVAYLITQQVKTNNELRKAEQEAIERRSLLQSVLSAHQDIETGARGYVISGDPAYLAPYDDARGALRTAARQLRENYGQSGPGGELVTELFGLSQRKQDISRRTVVLRRQGDKLAAEANVSSGQGKVVMDDIRRVIHGLTELEQSALQNLAQTSEQAIYRLRATMFGLLIVLSLLLFSAWVALQNLIRQRGKALGDAEDSSLRREAILQSAQDGIITLNPSGSIESVNAAVLKMFGYESSDLLRRDVGILFAVQPPLGAVAERLRALDAEESSVGFLREIQGRCSDGREFPTEVAISTVLLNEGLRYVAVIRDVTERKRMEQLKSEFVSTVSHELRTPLTSIAGALGLLANGAAGELDPRAERLVQIAHNNADRLVRLINDILDIEKLESGKMPFDNREIDLKAAVAASIDENRAYAAKFNASIALSAPMTPVLVMADRDRLAQVLTNLLSNASKYSPAGGVINVTISNHGEYHRVTVADQGPGIPAGFGDRIFGKFEQADSSDTRQKGGTGLGLSIVNEIVRRLDGQISYDSEPGKGARFHVDLPAHRPRAAEMTSRSSSPELLMCGNGIGTAFSKVLTEAGYGVTVAKEPEMIRNALASRRFDGIVVDMGLRNGNGIEVIRTVREVGVNADTPILALGGKMGGGELEGDAALVVDWLRKPVELSRLLDSVKVAGSMIETERPRVLHIEDDPDVVQLVAEALHDRAEVIAAEGVAAARLVLARVQFDLVIVDLGLADGSGVEILTELQRDDGGRPLPIIVFSAQDADPQTASLVDAYLTKARTPIGSLVSLVECLISAKAQEGKNS